MNGYIIQASNAFFVLRSLQDDLFSHFLQTFVGGELKDDKYWEKRGKNNIAARRSREARRLKENQIALRTAFLEKQNNGLKAALQAINSKNEKLELEKRLLNEKLAKYESMAAFLN